VPGTLIVYCCPGEVSAFFHESLLRLIQTDVYGPRNIVGRACLITGPRIASARNELVRATLRSPDNPEWMLMLDADMTFESDLVERFLDVADPVERPVVGGLCFGGGRGGKLFPTLYRIVDPATNDGKPISVIADYERDALVQVDATGAACLFVHRSVLLAMQDAYGTVTIQGPDGEDKTVPFAAPWFAESIHNGAEYGEDWTACLRMQRLGFPIYVHTGIKLGHVKPHVLDEEAWDVHYQKLKDLGQEALDREFPQRMGMIDRAKVAVSNGA
jgi:hypothetical protein